MNGVYSSVFELIDMRSFSNLWYWIALAVMWSTASHWVLGIPYDMVPRARRDGGQPMADLEDIARVNVNRLLYIARVAGLWLVGLFCFVHASLFTAGFFYAVEFAQAVFLLLFPLTIVWLLSVNTAKIIELSDLQGEALCGRITRHRFYVQFLGIIFIFVTAMWGMYQNFNIGALGG